MEYTLKSKQEAIKDLQNEGAKLIIAITIHNIFTETWCGDKELWVLHDNPQNAIKQFDDYMEYVQRQDGYKLIKNTIYDEDTDSHNLQDGVYQFEYIVEEDPEHSLDTMTIKTEMYWKE